MLKLTGTCVISLKAEDFSSTAHDFLSSMGILVDRDTKKVCLDKEEFDKHADRVANESLVTGLTLTTDSVIKSIAIGGGYPSKAQELELDSELTAKRLTNDPERKLRIKFESISSHLRYGVVPMLLRFTSTDRSSAGAR